MSISTSEISSELKRFSRDPKKISIMHKTVHSDEIEINKLKPAKVSKVNGKLHSVYSASSHLVQGFSTVWASMGGVDFLTTQIQNFEQKINYSFIPDVIRNTWLSDLAGEGIKPIDKPISQYIFSLMAEQVKTDINILSQKGSYDASKTVTSATQTPEFGYSLNGLNQIIADLKAARNSSTSKPCYHVKTDAITADNILDVVSTVEAGIPNEFRTRVPSVIMSTENKIRYQKKYQDTYGTFGGFDINNKNIKTLDYGRDIIDLSMMDNDTIICFDKDNFATVYNTIGEGQFRISDVQTQDYEVKIFADFQLGYGFQFPPFVFVNNSDAAITENGLQDDTLNKLLFPETYS